MKRLVIVLGMFVVESLWIIPVHTQLLYGDGIRQRIIARWLQAAQDNDIATFDSYVAHGINIDVQDDDEQTALMKAAEYGHAELVMRLITQGAHLNLADCYGNTALIKASIHGRCDIVQLLIEAKAKLMRRNKLGGTALIEAAAFGQCAVVKLLIPAIKAAYEVNADIDVSYMGIDDLRQLMLNELLNPLDVQDYEGRTALIQAAVHGYADIVTLLMDAGADPLVKDNEGFTAKTLVTRRYLKNKEEVRAALMGEKIQPAPKKRRVIYQRKSKINI